MISKKVGQGRAAVGSFLAVAALGLLGCGPSGGVEFAEEEVGEAREALSGGWTTLQLRNGWVQASNSNTPAVGIVNGIVTFRGALNGTNATSSVAFCLTSPTFDNFHPQDVGYITIPIALANGATGALRLDFPFEHTPPNDHFCASIRENNGSGSQPGPNARARTSLEGVTFDKSFQNSTKLNIAEGWLQSYPERGNDSTIHPEGAGVFAKVVSGFVRFQGVLLATNQEGVPSLLFTLPQGQGMIPGNMVFVPVMMCPNGGMHGRLVISSNGNVNFENVSPQDAYCGVSLDGASYSMSSTGAQAITLSSSWVSFSNRAVRARNSGGAIRLEGAVKNGTGATIGTLPSGMRPARTIQVVSNAQLFGSPAVLSINSSGVISVVSPSVFIAQSGITLDGVSFGL